jgi:hypothetical protein
VTNLIIDGWLDQFNGDRDLAARVLDSIDFYGQAQIFAAYRQALNSLPGWHRDHRRRVGRWRFAAMSGSAGESGDAMLYMFRLANQLDGRVYDPLFASRSELFRQVGLPKNDPHSLGEDDVVVLLDDFSGTGDQVCNAWNDPETSYGSFLSTIGRRYLILVAASQRARQRIATETGLSPFPAHEITDADSVFSELCPNFNAEDRVKLEYYGRKAKKKEPKGYGDCGFVVIFQHRAPNDSIPILHSKNARWTGLFPRHVPPLT